MVEFPKVEVNQVISNIENFQYKTFPEYYETNWIKALFYLFEDNDPSKGIRGSKDSNNTLNTSNLLTPVDESAKLRKKSKNKTSKQMNFEDDKKHPFSLKLKYRSHKHLVAHIIFIGVILIYFITDFGLVRIYMKKLLDTTNQLG